MPPLCMYSEMERAVFEGCFQDKPIAPSTVQTMTVQLSISSLPVSLKRDFLTIGNKIDHFIQQLLTDI